MGIAPQLSDAELVTLAMMQAMLGFTSEGRWLRYARTHLRRSSHTCPSSPGYNKRLRKAAGLIQHGAEADERETLRGLLAAEPQLTSDRPAQTLIGERPTRTRIRAAARARPVEVSEMVQSRQSELL